jgi:hypothetical protein
MKKRNLPCAAIKYVKDTLEQLMKDIVIANSPQITRGRFWGTNKEVLPIQTKIENFKKLLNDYNENKLKGLMKLEYLVNDTDISKHITAMYLTQEISNEDVTQNNINFTYATTYDYSKTEGIQVVIDNLNKDLNDCKDVPTEIDDTQKSAFIRYATNTLIYREERLTSSGPVYFKISDPNKKEESSGGRKKRLYKTRMNKRKNKRTLKKYIK